MSKCWVVEDDDGKVFVIHPDLKSKREEESYDEFYDRILTKTLESNLYLRGKPLHVIDSDAIPRDRDNRHAWRIKDGKLVVDLSIKKPLSLEDKIEAAKTIDELKDAILGR